MQEAMRKHTLGAETWRNLEDKFDANHKTELQKEYDAEIKDADEAGRPPNLKAPRKPKSFYELILELNAKMKASHHKHKKNHKWDAQSKSFTNEEREASKAVGHSVGTLANTNT